jgi:Hint domain
VGKVAEPSITSLGTYDGTILGDLTVDAAGNIYGEAETADGETVFELAPDDVFTTLGTFDYDTTGSGPTGGLGTDAAGNLYATTIYGGANRDQMGAVDVFSPSDQTLTALASTGISPEGAPVLDAQGDLFFAAGGTLIDEVIAGSGTVTVFATLPEGGINPTLTIDAAGNIYGTTRAGDLGYGSVFEVTADGTVETLVTFDGSNGSLPTGGLVADAAGNLYGNAHNLFELAVGSDAFTVLAGFTDGGASETNQIAVTADGTIYGTTTPSGGSPFGSLYELAPGTDSVTTLLSNADNIAGLTADPEGDLFGASGGQIYEVTPCFARDTRILTDRGEIAVEALRIGDKAVTADGRTRPIMWLGHRRLDLTRHPDPISVWPIRVREGAFGVGKPSRDLWLSPGHALAVEGALIEVGALQNGRTVEQVRCAAIEYWHVELDEHDVLLASGLPAESYLDIGNRTGFVNGRAFVEAHPDFMPRHWAETCLPLVFDGPAMERTRRSLLAHAKALGHCVTSESDVHVIADGRRIEAARVDAERAIFALPLDCIDISLRSRCFVPAHSCTSGTDGRSLGVCVKHLWLDGEAIALDDGARFGAGWHPLERDLGCPGHRWTRGSTPMPPGVRSIVIVLAGPGHYWDDSRSEMFGAAVCSA